MLNKRLSIFLLIIIIIVIVLSVIYIKINNKNTIYIGKIFHATGTLFTESEYEKYPDIIKNKKQLEEFWQSLRKPAYFQKDALKAYDDLVEGVKSKIFALLSSASLLRTSVAEINCKLESPDFKKNILLVTHQILQSNSHARKMLQVANNHLNCALKNLKTAIAVQSFTDQKIFSTREVYDITRRQFSALKNDYEKALDLKFDLQHRCISPQRAIAMAQNIFVNGDLKKLRAELRQLKKDEQRLTQSIRDFNQREKFFQSQNWSEGKHSDFLILKYSLAKQKTSIELEATRLQNLKSALEQRQNDLDSLCKKPNSLKQIQFIAAAILRKNSKFDKQIAEIDANLKQLSLLIDHIKKQLDAFHLQLNFEKRNTYYKISANHYSKNFAASLIADALLGEPQAVQLVARSTSNNFEMEKDWELMSDLDKDELLHKQIFRDL